MRIILAIILAFVAILATVPGYQLMWGWFATPVFHVAVPSFALMAGLGMLVGLFITHIDAKKDTPFDELVLNVILRILFVWLTVGLGFVFHLAA